MTAESKPPLMLEAGIIYYQLLRLLKFCSLKLKRIELNNEHTCKCNKVQFINYLLTTCTTSLYRCCLKALTIVHKSMPHLFH